MPAAHSRRKAGSGGRQAMGNYYLRRWPSFLVPFMAVPFGFTTAAAPAVQATLTPASAGCPAAEIVGVHGTSEGPSSTDSTHSPEIKAPLAAFATDEQQLGRHGRRLQTYSYPTVTFPNSL